MGRPRRAHLEHAKLVGANLEWANQIAGMARWEAGLVVIVGIGLGAAIAAAALVPFSQALTGSSIPDVEPHLLAGIVGGTAVLGVIASLLPTRLALRARPVDAIGLKD